MDMEVKAMVENSDNGFQLLVDSISVAISSARHKIATQINSAMTETYWQIGKYIVEYEQGGKAKVAYGTSTLTELSHQLTLRFGRGFSRPNLVNMRKFYLLYPNCQTVSDNLTWSHIGELLKVDDELERGFYEKECILFVSKYELYLPDKEELRQIVNRSL
jgi:hypothetical protein